ncbi:purine nucleoside phosphorylase [Catenaria anguillulae PL171]|uniref:Purine nucleoside phosphorylase n=1 Tax=Catenaria anguillulae PL171 TaxID=765915 RepID=A0A1Y2HDT2_9FUNG|nr:purine nucleoside phosphorylase [Catenaria anguillulae PL171]
MAPVVPTLKEYQAAADYLRSRIPADAKPTVGIVCGSGLGQLFTLLQEPVSVDYEEIPSFVKSTVAGHAGKLVFGRLGKQYVICMVGRFHPYEGYTPQQVTFPHRVMALLGIKLLIVTNAAGGLNESYNVGDIMCIADHVAIPMIAGNNPLVGPNMEEFGPRFPPTSDAYPKTVRKHAFKVAHQLGLLNKVHEGVYCFVSGPQYETRAECRLLRSIGGDAVGMSTVPEVVIARHAGIAVLGFSLITNRVVSQREPSIKEELLRELEGKTDKVEEKVVHASHAEVLAASKDFATDVLNLVRKVVEELHTVEGF